MPSPRDRKKQSKPTKPVSAPTGDTPPEPERYLPGSPPQSTKFYAPGKGGRTSAKVVARRVTRSGGGRRGGFQPSTGRARPQRQLTEVIFQPHVDADERALAALLTGFNAADEMIARVREHRRVRFTLPQDDLGKLRDHGTVLDARAA